MNSEIPQQVVNVLRERFEAAERPILGGTIGTIIFAHWPGLEKSVFRQAFGSLKDFLKTVFGDQVLDLGNKGADTVFGWKGKTYVLQPIAKDDKITWRLFANPKEIGSLIISSGHLKRILPDQAMPLDAKEVRRMTFAEQLQTARAFVENHVTKAESELFEGVFEPTQQYWGKFSAALRPNNLLFQRWKQFRFDSIERTFKDRCKDFGIPEDDLERLWIELRDGSSNLADPARPITLNSHQIIANAMQFLSEEELSAVQLPSRVWIELLKRHGHFTVPT